ncbi:2,4-dienoyl-CoA reductase-like NADH-dependent reductase (Old Yellow Enzyme family) [Blastococcus colisei]|uniref:2,4-dienoyl-CoA reductase-like NADH-dependent reductase (Old Yellow Enzyme family) n=1 Tax=Blastococcus colisei TaxID=1564162 RepID=A0A543PFF1_9ACTN|nr:NADH:flavin oxidoreductase/NADH oxidase [Blastococcus colisei]TQN42802.1 2,4-dienoyl-CoA reductase-like NADH-dependent reductase (Old Yellow Enzyme family) [Blastococcus colisei]
MSRSLLFSPFDIRGVRVRNRVVVSPMWQYAGRNGFPTDWHLMHLGRFADGGAGIVFQEGTTVERRGCGTRGDVGIWDDDFVAPLQRLASVISDNGSVSAIQLMHAGRKARMSTPMEGRKPLERSPEIPDWDEWEIVAPSAVPLREGLAAPRALALHEVEQVVQSFVDATARAARAGYQVVELHAGHGYLLHQFLSPVTNRRTDRYGGSLENRSRILQEIVEGVRAVWPQDRPVFVRMSAADGSGWGIEDTITVGRRLLAAGVDVIDCSSGGLVGSPMDAATPLSYGYQVQYASEVRRGTGAPTMAVGLIVHPEHAERIIAEGHADLVAVGREVLYNPNWPIDAAVKLGVEDPFSLASHRTAYWLRRRAESVPDLVPSTFLPGAGSGVLEGRGPRRPHRSRRGDPA